MVNSFFGSPLRKGARGILKIRPNNGQIIGKEGLKANQKR
jgi:hypothetical protein